MNLDNSDEFSMTFANAMRLDEWGYRYADLISDASSTSRKVSANWQDILAYSKERAEISSLIKDPLDTTLRASFANMVNQEFTVDKNGILGRKKVSETSDEFEDEQIRLINNLLIFTDDNWETAKTALGKIYYTDDDGKQVTSYGLIAETIIGSLIMSERLKIKNPNNTIEIGAEGIIIKKPDGTIVFQAGNDGTLIIRNYASQSSVDSLSGRVDEAEASIAVQAGQIALKASQDSLDALGNRVSSAETSITQNANAIKLKASQSSVDSLSGRVDEAEASIDTLADSISAKVSKTYGSSSSSFGWSLTSSGFYLYSNATTVMKVTSSGLEVSGKITATSGYIGKFAIGTNGNLSLSTTDNMSNFLDITKTYNSTTYNTRVSTAAIQLSREKSGTTNYMTLDVGGINSYPQLCFGYGGVYSGISFRQYNATYMQVCGSSSNFIIQDCGFGVYNGGYHLGITGQIRIQTTTGNHVFMRIDKGVITGLSQSEYSGYTDYSNSST